MTKADAYQDIGNVAATIRQGIDRLRSAIARLEDAQVALGQLSLTTTQREVLNYLAERVKSQVTSPPDVSDLDRNDREHEVLAWLEGHGFQETWQLSPTLVSMAYNTKGLNALSEGFHDGQLMQAVEWLAATHVVHDTLAEVDANAAHIAEVTGSQES